MKMAPIGSQHNNKACLIIFFVFFFLFVFTNHLPLQSKTFTCVATEKHQTNLEYHILQCTRPMKCQINN